MINMSSNIEMRRYFYVREEEKKYTQSTRRRIEMKKKNYELMFKTIYSNKIKFNTILLL